MKERGITLIALIITIILLIILAAVSINIVYKNSMIDIAVNGAKDYVDVAQKEQEEMDDLSNFLDVAKNRRPYLNVNIREIGETFCIIEAKAKDEDGGKLTYKLYFGASRDNLEEKEEKKAEQGKAVEWNVTGLTEGATYYYKVEVKDEYETVESGIREVVIKKNKAPVITKVELVSKKKSSVKIKALATDEDGDRLIYKLYLGTDASNLTKKAESGETAQGMEVTLETNEYNIYKTYYYRIEVTDGKLTTSSDIEEIEKMGVGTYVAYKPEVGIYSVVTNNSTYTGITNNTADFTTEEFNWRIWDIDEEKNEIVLIADKVTTKGGYNNEGRLYLTGAQGYNNGVKILNDIGKTCYSNSELGAIGRSINIEDIESVLDRNVWKPEDNYVTIDTKQYHIYNENEYMTYTSARYYPYIWELEEYSWIDNTRKTKGQGITRSQQNELYTATQGGSNSGYKQASSKIQLTITLWTKSFTENNFIEKEYYNVLLKKDNAWAGVHWIASRGVSFASTQGAYFDMQFVSNDDIYGHLLFSSSNSSLYDAHEVRPMVSIPLDSVVFGETGGTIENPISIQKK